jgi:aminoglycoside 3-N-acetyltransferase
VEGVRRWVPFEEPLVLDDDFADAVAAFDRETGAVRRGRVGRADACLLPQRPLVDFAAGWFPRHRD